MLHASAAHQDIHAWGMLCAVIGTPGIGKSVFAWWFIRCLAALGFTVVYRAEKASESLLCKDRRVLAGPHSAFKYLQEDTNTW